MSLLPVHSSQPPGDREMSPPADLGTLLGSAEQTMGGLVADTNRVGLLVPLQQPGVPLVILYMHSYSAAPSGLLFRLYLSGFLDS